MCRISETTQIHDSLIPSTLDGMRNEVLKMCNKYGIHCLGSETLFKRMQEDKLLDICKKKYAAKNVIGNYMIHGFYAADVVYVIYNYVIFGNYDMMKTSVGKTTVDGIFSIDRVFRHDMWTYMKHVANCLIYMQHI